MGIVGITTVSSVINSIGIITYNIYNLIGTIRVSKNTYHKEIINILVKTDIEHNIRLVQSILKELPLYYNTSNSTMIILKDIKDIMKKIENQLIDIHNKIIYNSSIVLLSNWRSYNFKEHLDELTILIEVFERRKDNLFKLISIFKSSKIDITENSKLLAIEDLHKTEITQEFIKSSELI